MEKGEAIREWAIQAAIEIRKGRPDQPSTIECIIADAQKLVEFAQFQTPTKSIFPPR